jgi:hypothetical protein
MSVIVKLASGSWRAQVRRKGIHISNTSLRQHDAEEWALAAERDIDRGFVLNRLPSAQFYCWMAARKGRNHPPRCGKKHA